MFLLLSLFLDFMIILDIFHHAHFIISKLINLVYHFFVFFEASPPSELLVAKNVAGVDVVFGYSDVLVLLSVFLEFERGD
jgi:hypothetical protein